MAIGDNPFMNRLPTSDEIVDLERSKPGTEFASKGYDRMFLNRMQNCGYLDSGDRCTRGLERLRHQYDNDGVVLFLGAGVSKASGIPEWRELIDLMLKTLEVGPAAEKGLSLSRLLEEKGIFLCSLNLTWYRTSARARMSPTSSSRWKQPVREW
jgi:hypothetical protein